MQPGNRINRITSVTQYFLVSGQCQLDDKTPFAWSSDAIADAITDQSFEQINTNAASRTVNKQHEFMLRKANDRE